MKKRNLFVYPLLAGVFGGAFIECGLYLLSIMLSPFSTYEQKGVFLFCGIFTFLMALLITGVIILDAKYLISLNSSKVKLMIIAQVCTVILISLAFCPVFEKILDLMLESV